MNKQITFVIGCLEVGGAETQMTLLAEGLVNRGWHVDVFTLEKTGPLISRLEACGAVIIDGGFTSFSGSKVLKFLAIARAQLRLVIHLLRSRPHTVHSFLPLTNFMGSLAGKLTVRPCVVISKRGLGTHQDRNPIFGKIDWISNKLAHFVTANSTAIALDTERRDGFKYQNVIVVNNGYAFKEVEGTEQCRENGRAALGLVSDEIAIVNVANLIPYKGQEELIDAYARLTEKISNTRLYFIGQDRGIEARLKRQAASLGIADKLEFLGFRSNVKELLMAMDIGVLPSHEEGLPNALIEMLAVGLPVVASDVGGIPDVCENVPDSYLVPAKNSEALANALLFLCENIEAAKQKSFLRQDIMRKRYELTKMVKTYESMYISNQEH